MELQNLSQKQGTLVAILQLGGYVREVKPIVSHLRTKFDMATDDHNIAHVLWPLSKENRVTFQERKVHGGESSLTNIRLTEKGVQTARDLLGLNVEEQGRVHHAPNSGSRATRAVGRDNTDFRQHASVASGGPIERRVEKETPLDYVPFVVLPEDEAERYRAKPLRVDRVGAKNLIAQETEHHPESVIDESEASPRKALTSPPMEATSQGMEAAPQDIPSDTPTEYPEQAPVPPHVLRRVLDFNPDQFPLLAATLGKRERIERYTKAAELLGDDEAEIAIALLEKIKISPLEEEIIRLLG